MSATGNGVLDSPDKRRLLERIRRRFTTIHETLCFGDQQIEFTRVGDLNVILDGMSERGSESPDLDGTQWQPYWAEVWSSSQAIISALCQRELAGRRVLDLGCGLGLTGAVVASLGAKVVLVDAAPPALLFARLNTWPWRTRVEIRRFDWNKDRLDGHRFDLIVGSDILYDREDWAALWKLWDRVLNLDGEVLLGEPGRSMGKEFLHGIDRQLWQVEVAPWSTTHRVPINIISLRRARRRIRIRS